MTESPIMLIDRPSLRMILRMTFSILRNNFFYDEDQLKDFLHLFSDDFSTALMDFGDNAEKHILQKLTYSRATRFNFTCYFASEVIRDVLIDDFHFNETELQAFENVMSKYTRMR